MDTVYKCKEECISWGCVAFAYSYDNDYCDLYRNGPYTYGSGSKSTKCYIMPSGNLYIYIYIYIWIICKFYTNCLDFVPLNFQYQLQVGARHIPYGALDIPVFQLPNTQILRSQKMLVSQIATVPHSMTQVATVPNLGYALKLLIKTLQKVAPVFITSQVLKRIRLSHSADTIPFILKYH